MVRGETLDKSKPLEELENEYWGQPDFDSNLITECHRLRKVALDKLTVENLRILIGQQIGLVYLLPLALDQLETDLLSSGDFYSGDLLNSVTQVDDSFWDNNPELNNRVVELKTDIEQAIETLSESLLTLEKRSFI